MFILNLVPRVFGLFLTIGYSQGRSQGGARGGGRSPTQSSEKPFFQNVEIRVENSWGDYLIVKEDQFTTKRGKNTSFNLYILNY